MPAIWFALLLAAQTGTTLRVTVTDPSGGVIVGAHVDVTDEAGTQIGLSVSSNARGEALFEGLEVGRYTIRVESAGFEPFTARGVRVRAEENRRMVRLALARLAETVRVERDPRTRGSDPRGDAFATLLTQRQIDDLPDDPDELERLLNELAGPGATIRVNGFRGGRLPAKDQIQQIRFRRSVFAADTHEPGGVAVDITTKPGLETWRGSLTGAGRVSGLNARNAFAPIRPDERLGRYAFSLSGPLWKNHTSFTMSTDGSEASEAKTIVAALPSGRFSGLIRRPLTARNISVRLDHALSSSMLRLELQRHRTDAGSLGAGDFDLAERGYSQSGGERVVRIAVAGSVRRTAFNEFRLQQRSGESEFSPATAQPAILVLNAFNAGGAQIDGARRTNALDVADDLDLAFGNHAVRMGLLVEQTLVDSNLSRNTGGTFTFANLDAFAAGRPTTFTRNVGDPHVRMALWQTGAYVQDDYRARKDLTISGGIRVEHQTHIGGVHAGPRGGFTWSPFRRGTTTIRGGAGLYFDWFEAATYEQVLQLDGSHQAIETVVDAGVMALPAGRVQLSVDLAQPRSAEARIGVEQVLPQELRINATVARRRGARELRGINVNAPIDGVRPLPLAGLITEVSSTARSKADSLTLNVTYAPSGRRIFVASTYLLSRSIDEAGSALALPANSYDLSSERGPAANDARHRFNALFSTPVAGRIRVGFSIRLQSALPYNIITGRDDNGDTVSNDRPVGVTRNSGRGYGLADVGARVAWSKGFGRRPTGGGAPGPQTRTRGDDGNPLASIGGGIDFTKRYTVELSLQAFNALNRANLLNVSGVAASPFFGRATSAAPPRRIELGARLAF